MNVRDAMGRHGGVTGVYYVGSAATKNSNSLSPTANINGLNFELRAKTFDANNKQTSGAKETLLVRPGMFFQKNKKNTTKNKLCG